jgi:poly(A) polymerase
MAGSCPAISATSRETMSEGGALGLQPWMSAPETQRVIAALAAKGAELRFVGGCVRDALLGRPIQDIDIATHDPPETVMALLEAAGIRAIPTGIAHGTVTAVVGKAHFEITTLRRDVETDGRHAKVAFTDDWREDAARRDLTINAIFATPEGALYDPFGGLADLRAGRIRFVGDPETRIREDHLRLLRYFRFYAHYGKHPPDAAALAACRALAPLLSSLSGERIAAESFKLLAAPEPASVLAAMREAGILAHFLPEAASGPGIETLRALVTIEGPIAFEGGGSGSGSLRRLAALLDPAQGEAQALDLARRWHLSAAERDRLAGLIVAEPALEREMTAKERRRLLHRLGAESFRDRVLLAWAREVARRGTFDRRAVEAWREHLDAARGWRPVELPVRGQDLLELGLAPGPELGRLLAAVEQWWIDEDFAPDRAACLAKLAALARPAR